VDGGTTVTGHKMMCKEYIGKKINKYKCGCKSII